MSSEWSNLLQKQTNVCNLKLRNFVVILIFSWSASVYSEAFLHEIFYCSLSVALYRVFNVLSFSATNKEANYSHFHRLKLNQKADFDFEISSPDTDNAVWACFSIVINTRRINWEFSKWSVWVILPSKDQLLLFYIVQWLWNQFWCKLI